MVRVLIGDMFKSEAEALVNSVNCVGVLGKGIALEFKRRFPWMVEDYINDCSSGRLKPGILTMHKNMLDKHIVINFPTKDHWRSPTLLKDIEQGLDYFKAHYKTWKIKSVAFPPLGCGSGGLSWDVVGPLMYAKLHDLDITVEIYAPYGTSVEKTKSTFLKKEAEDGRVKGNRVRSTLKPGEIAVLEALWRLQQERYAKPIGRVMFQKACYVLTEAGVPTDFTFEKYSYGPFSRDAEQMHSILANNNLTLEEKAGPMMKLVITDNYRKIRGQYAELIKENETAITKATDLLGRIKNTDQGEEVATIIFSYKMLQTLNKRSPTVDEISTYIFDWKPVWQVSESRRGNLLGNIEGLAMLGWIKIQDTKDMKETLSAI